MDLTAHLALILVACLLDAAFGDPVYRWHPIRLLGGWSLWWERRLFAVGLNGYWGGALHGLLVVGGALAAVELNDFQRRPIRSLSAGQFQRVLFARMLLQDARLILLDEPFTAIDARTTADLLDVVRAWHAEQRTVIAVLHDLEQVRAHFPETLLLARSGIAWGQTCLLYTSRCV